MSNQNPNKKENFDDENINKILANNLDNNQTGFVNLENKPTQPETSEAERNIPTPEKSAEFREKIKSEQPEKEGFIDESIEGLKKKLKSTKRKPQQIPQVRDEVTVAIEKIMEEDLKDAYQELTPIQKQEFKIKGEETANEIRTLLTRTHVKVKNIFKLILGWLKMLPGINKFFLEQEAKIKTDKILAIKEHNKKI